MALKGLLNRRQGSSGSEDPLRGSKEERDLVTVCILQRLLWPETAGMKPKSSHQFKEVNSVGGRVASH